jgi:hypothetical protein
MSVTVEGKSPCETHEGLELVQKDEEQTDIGKVKDDAPIGELALFVDLVIEDKDHHGCDK